MRLDTAGDTEELREAHRRIAELEDEVRSLRLALDVSSTLDTRTGLGNRNAILDAIEDRSRWLERNEEPFGVVVVMFDHHVDGAHIAAMMQAGLRGVDSVASWGEWVIGAVLPSLTIDSIDVVDARIREALAACGVTPVRVAYGFPGAYPSEMLLRALELGSAEVPGATIIER